jgi:hypothetical protein
MVPAQNYETLKKSERRSTSFLKANIDIYQFTYNYSHQKSRSGFLKKRTHHFITLCSVQMGEDCC